MTVLILMVTKMMTIFSRSFQGVGHYCVPPSLLSSSARISFHVSSHVWLSLCALSLFRLFLSHRLNKESKISSHVFLRRRCLTTNCSISCLSPPPPPPQAPRAASVCLHLPNPLSTLQSFSVLFCEGRGWRVNSLVMQMLTRLARW